MNRKKIVSFKINLLVFSVLSTLNMATVVQADPSAHIVVQQQQKIVVLIFLILPQRLMAIPVIH
ncbi:hemagglutinin [Proteus mirabilis]|nr:hypothetical protein [Proteus mirabilis]SUC05692.1 hemagglutinin [Proteus mirabilis]